MWSLIGTAGTVALIGAGLLARSSYERSCLVTDEFEIRSPKLEKEYTFAFLSDLHDNCFGDDQNVLLDAIEQARPDAVLIGGDMMVSKGRGDLDISLNLLRQLTARYPVYYGNGNHENRMNRERDVYGDRYDIYVEELKKMGVAYLPDTSVDVYPDIRISGVDLEERFYKKFSRAQMEKGYLEKRLGKAHTEKFQILLAHSPLFLDAYAAWGADLVLSGHFHGGTIRIPGLGGLMTPQFQFFKDCCGGLLKEHHTSMIVSRGLGTHSINIRLNNKPELVVIHLNADKHSPASSARNTKRRVRGGCFCQWELKAPTDRSRSDCVHEQVAKRIANVRFTRGE